jgi:hypothetical protein
LKGCPVTKEHGDQDNWRAVLKWMVVELSVEPYSILCSAIVILHRRVTLQGSYPFERFLGLVESLADFGLNWWRCEEEAQILTDFMMKDDHSSQDTKIMHTVILSWLRLKSEKYGLSIQMNYKPYWRDESQERVELLENVEKDAT